MLLKPLFTTTDKTGFQNCSFHFFSLISVPKKHGIISIVQSPDEGQNTSDDLNQSDTENTSRKPEKEHCIISIVQAPEKDRDKH